MSHKSEKDKVCLEQIIKLNVGELMTYIVQHTVFIKGGKNVPL